MYKLKVLTHKGYTVAVFEAGNTIKEANNFYKEFKKFDFYPGYLLHITTK